MTRHARNNTAGACYTYHERQRDGKASGFGTQKERLSKDSIKDFDACCLTLQPCRNPVITPDGFLYDKEAILEYIIHKKSENVQKVKDYEKQKRREEKDEAELVEAEEKVKSDAFVKLEKSLPSSGAQSSVGSKLASTISNMSADNKRKLPSFWIPSETPQAKKTKVKKPDTTVYCPMSEKPIKAKDLYPVLLTPIDKTAVGKTYVASQTERYMCPVTHDVIGNSVPCAFLKTSGSVVTKECLEKIIRKDMMDPTNGKKLKESDIIHVQRGGTGYSSTNQVTAEMKGPALQA
jgi:nitric oxide synthase-interacting protein